MFRPNTGFLYAMLGVLPGSRNAGAYICCLRNMIARTGARHRPYSLRRGGRRTSSPCPRRHAEGAERRKAHPSCIRSAHVTVRGRLSALHRGFFRRRAALLKPALQRAGLPRPAKPCPISELLAAGRSARGRSPGAARVRGDTLSPRPRAPPLLPFRKRPCRNAPSRRR